MTLSRCLTGVKIDDEFMMILVLAILCSSSVNLLEKTVCDDSIVFARYYWFRVIRVGSSIGRVDMFDVRLEGFSKCSFLLMLAAVSVAAAGRLRSHRCAVELSETSSVPDGAALSGGVIFESCKSSSCFSLLACLLLYTVISRSLARKRLASSSVAAICRPMFSFGGWFSF